MIARPRGEARQTHIHLGDLVMTRLIKLGSIVGLFLGMAVTVSADEAKGTIRTVDTKRQEVVIKGLVNDSHYDVNKDATVWLDGFRCKLADLAANDRAVIIYDKRGDHMMASMVRGLRNAQETSGTVADVVKEKRELTLKGVLKNTTYELTKKGTVWVDGKESTLSDIRAGDEVLLTYERRGDHNMVNDISARRNK